MNIDLNAVLVRIILVFLFLLLIEMYQVITYLVGRIFLVCPSKWISLVLYSFNLGYKDYERTLQGIDLDTVSLPPRSFVLLNDDLYSADI
jgi:hypothetical protein